MIVLGIDHAVASVMGTGLIESIPTADDRYLGHGAVKAPNIPYPKNMGYMYSNFIRLIQEEHPGLVVFEEQKDNRGFIATQRLHEIQGAFKVFCVHNHIPFLSIPPSTMKKIITGNGWASKYEVAVAVAEKLGVGVETLTNMVYYKQGSKKGQLKDKVGFDSSDALGLCLAWRTYLKIVGGNLDYDGK